MKKSLSLILTFVLLLCMMPVALADSAMQDGSYTATSQGFGGPVDVTINVSGGVIDKVEISGAQETEGIGLSAFDSLAASIIASQDASIDTVTGATMTSKAVIAAAQDCFNQASGTVAAEAKLADGTYTAGAWSFATNRQLNVSVDIADGKIAAITVGENGDTEIMLNTAIDFMIPKMLEYQSVKVDSITGATISSSAIKLAVEDCLLQALAAAGADAGAISAFYITPEKKTDVETIDTNVLVVGMGGSGITSAMRTIEALRLANSDVEVMMIDKAAKYGGTSVTTTSPMSINPSYFVEKNGGEEFVDAAVLKAAWIEYTEGDAKEWAIDYMMNHSGESVDWLIGQGFEFGAPSQGLSAPYKVCVNYGDQMGISKSIVQTYFDTIIGNFTDKGGKYMLDTEAVALLPDEGGKIAGVTAVHADGTTYTINADYVVLATGGFAGSGEMEDKYLSDEYFDLSGGGRYNLYGMAQNDGKMIQAAIDLGAATYNIGMPPVSHIGGAYTIMHEYPVIELDQFDFWTGMNATQSLNDIPMMLAVAPNSLAVSREGVRFADETTLTAYGNWAAGAYYYTLWSNDQIKGIQDEGLKFGNIGIFINQGGWPTDQPIPEVYDILETGIKMGYIFKGDTLEELAAKLDVDAATLATTVSDYNAYCETKENPADGIEKHPVIYDISGNPMPGEYDVYEKVEGDGPFYAVKGSPWIYSTTGALDVNEQFEVLNTQGNPIEGLYAVGTDCLGILFTEKKEYVTYGGADQGWAFTSGYLAGMNIAEKILAS